MSPYSRPLRSMLAFHICQMPSLMMVCALTTRYGRGRSPPDDFPPIRTLLLADEYSVTTALLAILDLTGLPVVR
jgi:hypothetical protein